MKKIYTAVRETGDFIEEVKSVDEGWALIANYEADDKAEGTFEPDFYDVVDEEHCSVWVNEARSLKAYRIARGLSQRQLSELAGVNLQMIRKYEQGVKDINKVQLQTACKLAQALGCSAEDLLERR